MFIITKYVTRVLEAYGEWIQYRVVQKQKLDHFRDTKHKNWLSILDYPIYNNENDEKVT